MLDSGTTFTYLPSPAFAPFLATVKAYALAHGLRIIAGPDKAVRCSAYQRLYSSPLFKRNVARIVRIGMVLSIA